MIGFHIFSIVNRRRRVVCQEVQPFLPQAVRLAEQGEGLFIPAPAVGLHGRDTPGVAVVGIQFRQAQSGFRRFLRVAAQPLGTVLRRRQRIHGADLEGPLKDVGHEMEVKVPLPAAGVGAAAREVADRPRAQAAGREAVARLGEQELQKFPLRDHGDLGKLRTVNSHDGADRVVDLRHLCHRRPELRTGTGAGAARLCPQH